MRAEDQVWGGIYAIIYRLGEIAIKRKRTKCTQIKLPPERKQQRVLEWKNRPPGIKQSGQAGWPVFSKISGGTGSLIEFLDMWIYLFLCGCDLRW
ncbi:MAG TPA: hypothetical protein PLY93_12370, partial [Turneriella sp.]|nr:hypothetical protein [Turneriella sp.]